MKKLEKTPATIVDVSYLQWADGLNNDIHTVQELQLSGSFWLINNER